MRSHGAYFAVAVLSFSLFGLAPATAIGLRVGPLHFGIPLGHRHHHQPHHDQAARHSPAQQGAMQKETGRRGSSNQATLVLLYPGKALSAVFQNVFWPAFSSPWPFGYETIFSTAFAPATADRAGEQCVASFDANAMVERLRAEIGPSPEQMEGLQRLGGAMAAAAGYLAKSCPAVLPKQPTARLQLMDSQIEVLTLAIDMIHQPLQQFEQSLTREQAVQFNGETQKNTTAHAHKARSRNAAADNNAGPRRCGASAAVIGSSIDQIDQSVQLDEEQRPALSDLQQAFGRAAGDLKAHCPTAVPQSAAARLEAIEARLDATWRAILSIQVALYDFESRLSPEQKNRFQTMTFAAQ
jgi:hypothetical protein